MPEAGGLPEDVQRTLIHGYHAAVSYMDAQLGRVIDALAASSLDKNTIIVLWGDHGWHLGDHGMWCKHSNYEQAARIPLIVVAPGATAGGAASAALVESVDIYPTLCELAGLPVPENLDGRSFAAVLKNPTSNAKDSIFHVYPRGNRIGRAVRTSRYRLVEWKRPGAPADSAVLELYDYDADPDERKNLAGERPEVVAELRKVLADQPEAKPQLGSQPARRRGAAAQGSRP
jgi:iduronate 2-sulfatase